jgi:linoleoyl-CoA desaturase
MKDKHISIPAHSKLQQQIYREVHNGLQRDKQATTRLLWTKGIVYTSLMMAGYCCLYIADSAAVFVAAYIGYGVLAVLMGFNFAHDFSHNTVFRSKWLNNACFTFLYTLVGAHAEAWKHRHVHSHHYAPNVRDYDSDLQITSLVRVEPSTQLRWFHRFQHLYAPVAYTSYSLYWVFIKDFVIYFGDDEVLQKKKPGYHVSFWLQKAFYFGYLLMCPLLLSGQPIVLVLSAFLVMHLVQSLFLLFTFFMTHHVETTEYFEADEQGYIRTSWLNNQISSSNDFYPFSRAANFIFGGFNNHIAHHLFPHIHHVYYPALNRILYRVLRENGVQPNVTTYFGGVRAHLRYLRRMSR